MPRTRITIDIEEAYKRAFSAWANLEGVTVQDLFQRLIQDNCPAHILKHAKSAVPPDDDEGVKRKKGE